MRNGCWSTISHLNPQVGHARSRGPEGAWPEVLKPGHVRQQGTAFMTQCARMLPLQLCPALCNPKDCSPPGSSVHGIPQARLLEWVAIPLSRGSSQPRDRTTSLMSPALAEGFFTTSTTWEEICNFYFSSTPMWREGGQISTNLEERLLPACWAAKKHQIFTKGITF